MTRRRLVAVLPFVLCAASTVAAQTDPPRPVGTFVTCENVHSGRQVTLFSEGTAWQGEKWVWLTVFNPTSAAQRVWVEVYVDGGQKTTWTVSIPAKARQAWSMNDEIGTRLGLRGRVNFATTVHFTTLGAANIAVWSWDYQAVPVYLLGTNLCVTWTS